MADPAATAFVEMGLRDVGLRQGLSRVRSEVTGFGQALTAVVPGLGNLQRGLQFGVAGAAVFAGAKILDMAGDMAVAGAQSERLRESFSQVWEGLGEDSSTALGRLRMASRGTISDMDLMLASNRAALLGVATSTDQLAQLMEIASYRGRAMGRTMTEAFNDIVTGIGRASPLILDNLGIVVNMEEANARYAQSVGKTVEALTEAEKRQVLLNEVLRTGSAELAAAGGVATDTAETFDRLKVAWGRLVDELQREVAVNLAGPAAMAADMLDSFLFDPQELAAATTSYEQFVKVWETETAKIQRSIKLLDILSFGVGDKLADFFGLNGIEDNIPTPDIDAWYALRGAIAGDTAAADDLLATMNAISGDSLLDVANKAAIAEAAINNLTNAAQISLDVLGQNLLAGYNQIVNQVTRAVADDLLTEEEGRAMVDGFMDGATAAVQQAELSNEPIDLFGTKLMIEEDLQSINREIDARQNARVEASRIAARGVSDQEKAARDAAQAWEEEMRRIRSAVESVISPTFAGDPSGLLDQMGLHVDTADEDARRLASVMAEGLSSEWTSYFAQKGLLTPEDLLSEEGVRAKAARVLREFQLGLRPELVDKETAKQRVREILLGQERTEQLVNEIMQELGAEGVRATRQQIQYAVTGTSTLGSGVVASQVEEELATKTVQVQASATVQLTPLDWPEVDNWVTAAKFLFQDPARQIWIRPQLADLLNVNVLDFQIDTNALLATKPVMATTFLGDLTIDEVNRWARGAEGFQDGLIVDATVALPDSTGLATTFMENLILAIQNYPMDPDDLVNGVMGKGTEGGAITRALQTLFQADLSSGGADLLVGLGQSAGQEFVEALAQELSGGENGLNAVEAVANAISADLAANGQDRLGLQGKSVGITFAEYVVEGMAQVEYISPLSDAMSTDFGVNSKKLEPIARAVGSYVGILISDEIKKNVNVVQGVIDAAVEQMANALIDAAEEGQTGQ